MNSLISNTASMDSKEIAELVNSRHDSVKRTVETLVDKGVIVQPQTVDEQSTDSMGRTRITKVYLFTGEQGKRDSIVVVAQLSPEFTARLVDRWQELEQQLVTVNAVPIPMPGSESARIAHETIEMGILFGAPRHLLQIEAVKNVERLTGKDFSNLLALSPYMDNIPADEVMLEPSDIAKHYGLKGSTHDGAIINQVLAAAGLQFKNSAGAWQPTVDGEPLAQRHGWSKNGKSGYNLKWRLSGIAHILDAHFGYESGNE